MRYWINRRARELSLRFMYSIDIDDQDSLDAIKNINRELGTNYTTDDFINRKKLIEIQKWYGQKLQQTPC